MPTQIRQPGEKNIIHEYTEFGAIAQVWIRSAKMATDQNTEGLAMSYQPEYSSSSQFSIREI
jgi:hypothetical protein